MPNGEEPSKKRLLFTYSLCVRYSCVILQLLKMDSRKYLTQEEINEIINKSGCDIDSTDSDDEKRNAETSSRQDFLRYDDFYDNDSTRDC